MSQGRAFLLSLLVFAVAFGGTSYYMYLANRPCARPITYRVGSVDPRFGVTESAYAADIEKAVRLWESASGKDLFRLDEHGDLVINLVYDRRQQLTQQEQALTASISATAQVADSVKAEYATLRAQYDAGQAAYARALDAFLKEQTAYNQEVAYWNSRGGAPKAQYETLAAQKVSLEAAQNALEAQRAHVNALADAVNTYIAKYNLLVSKINTDVRTINNDGLAGTQFEEGVYISDNDGERITIFQFENQMDLLRVLAHELGHALSLSHVADENAIMNPVNRGDQLVLTNADIAELRAVCGEI